MARPALWEVSPRDPLTLVASVIVVALAGQDICVYEFYSANVTGPGEPELVIPARQATKVDPLETLKHE